LAAVVEVPQVTLQSVLLPQVATPQLVPLPSQFVLQVVPLPEQVVFSHVPALAPLQFSSQLALPEHAVLQLPTAMSEQSTLHVFSPWHVLRHACPPGSVVSLAPVQSTVQSC
jgi:hypothetical protein